MAIDSVVDGTATALHQTLPPPQPVISEQTFRSDDTDNQSNHDKTSRALTKNFELSQLTSDNWVDLYLRLAPGGLLQSTLVNSIYLGRQGNKLQFMLDEQENTLYDSIHQQQFAELLTEQFQQTVEVLITSGRPQMATPAQIICKHRQQRQQQAEQAIYSDPLVRQLQDTFGAEIVKNSIEPID